MSKLAYVTSTSAKPTTTVESAERLFLYFQHTENTNQIFLEKQRQRLAFGAITTMNLLDNINLLFQKNYRITPVR